MKQLCYIPHQPYREPICKAVIGVLLIVLVYAALLLSPLLLFGQPQSRVVVIGGPPAVTVNDSVYGSRAGAHWETFLNKNQRTHGAWNPNTGRAFINRIQGSTYTTATKSGNTITIPDALTGLSFKVTFTRGGWSETGTITLKSAMTFNILRATDLPNVAFSGDTMWFTNGHTPSDPHVAPMRAWDATQRELTVTQTVTSLGVQQGYPTWRVKYAIDTTGAVYPVTFDPSIIINGSSTGIGYTSVTGSSGFLVGRNATTAGTASNTLTNVAVGIDYGAPDYYFRREFVAIYLNDSIPAGATITAATFDQRGSSNNSTVDFTYAAYTSYQPSTLTTASHILFDGWKATGNYSGRALTDSINTSGFVLNNFGNILTFNSYGLDTIQARFDAGDSVKFVILSIQDVVPDSVANRSLVQFGSTAPRFSLTYTLPDGISSATALDSNRVIIVYDTTGAGTKAGFVIDTVRTVVVQGTDTVLATGTTRIGVDGLTDTVTVAWADSNMTFFARYIDASPSRYVYGSNSKTARTRAANTAPLMGGWSQKSIFFKALQGSNRPKTHLALICSTAAFGPKILKITGDTSAVGVADSGFNKFSVWQTADSIFSKPRFAAATKPTVWAIWKNGDSLKTSRSVAISDSTFGNITLTAGFLDSTRVTGTVTLSAVPRWVTTLLTWLGASSSHADSAVTDTVTFTPGVTHVDTAGSKVRTITPNTQIALVGNIRLNGRDSIATSSTDTIWTDPLPMSASSIQFTTDTSVVLTVGLNGNPPKTLFGIIDSALVRYDSTNVFLGATALSSTIVLWDTAGFPDTLRWVRGSGVAQEDSTDLYIIVASGDSTANGL